MPNTYYLEIVTPERKFFSGEVESLIFRTPDGELGVLKNHIPMGAAVAIGPVKIKKDDGKWVEAVLTEGFMEVTRDKTIILTDTAEWPDEIDVERAKAAKQRAEERLMRKLSEQEFIRSQAALARALARLRVKKEIK